MSFGISIYLLRLAVALCSLGCSLLLFGFAGGAWLQIWAQAQIGPQLAAMAATGAAAAFAGVGAQLLAAWLFGRFYCSLLCPLGILQEVTGFLLKSKKSATGNFRRCRYLIAVVVFLMLAAGAASGLWLLEPFSNFGAMAAAFFAPAAAGVYNDIFPGNAVIVRAYDHGMLLAGALPLVLLALLVWRWRRIYCTAVCPVGTLLGICSAHGVWRMKMRDNCVHCNRCAAVCPADCIDVGAGKIDNERCLRCLKCMSACKLNAIGFTQGRIAPPRVSVPAAPDIRRRNFLIGGAAGAAAIAVGALGGIGAVGRKTGATSGGALPILPPGAGSPERFAARCTGCQLCVSNCTGNVLRAADRAGGTVHLKFDRGMCEFYCKKCSTLCPTGALLPLDAGEKQRRRIGLAEFFPSLCVAVQDGTDCGACAEHCPTGALRMVERVASRRVPELNAELCIGCGSCEYPCPVRPLKAIRVKGVPIQLQAADPVEFFRNKEKPVEKEQAKTDDWLV